MEIPPVGIRRPALTKSRTRKFVPLRRFWLASAWLVAVSFIATASLNVVMAVPMTARLIAVATSSSRREKPASEGCVRISPLLTGYANVEINAVSE